MRTPSKKSLITGAAVLLAAGFVMRGGTRVPQAGSCCSGLSMAAFAAEASKPAGTNAPAKAKLPRLLDLGAGKCIPCKMMAPILEDLKREYEGQMQVDFIDVWKDPSAGKAYGINLIPTQIFYGAGGKELFRHEGFFSKEDILAKWKKLGVGLKPEARAPKAEGSPKSERSAKSGEGASRK
jgi:thioredoxin 1